MAPLISAVEVSKHNTKSDCWVILNGEVYDLTNFLPEHPAGANIILKYAGKDGSKAFNPIHPSDIIQKLLPANVHKGKVDPKTMGAQVVEKPSQEELDRQKMEANKPPLSQMLNMWDFEAVAKHVLKKEAWAYYSSGADDEITLRENHAAFGRIWLKPRVLVDVAQIDMSTTILGVKTSIPVGMLSSLYAINIMSLERERSSQLYISATALGRLGHPDGECNLTRAAYTHDIIQMIPTLASCTFDEIRDAAQKGQPQFMQLYVNKDRKITEAVVKKAEAAGCKGLFITVDAPQLGRREKDMRMKFADADDTAIQKSVGDRVERNQGAARAISSFIDPSLKWSDIAWFKSITKMPIVLKGVQCAEDAVLAYQHGCAGIVLSNHGGRQLDWARSGIEILPEVMDVHNEHAVTVYLALDAIGARDKLEVYVDGGVRRATDILKAVALGAKAVGIGRPLLYAMSAYGQAGVERALDLLKDELEMNMRLMGTPTIKDITKSHVITDNLNKHISFVEDFSLNGVYERAPVSGIPKL
ncbi:hypothetical protein HDU93_000633 [Gonapodya sp. JEL0774]|nr:hypothetical protein HDU93_000633 [Gonapodya sp. JEL0774]